MQLQRLPIPILTGPISFDLCCSCFVTAAVAQTRLLRLGYLALATFEGVLSRLGLSLTCFAVTKAIEVAAIDRVHRFRSDSVEQKSLAFRDQVLVQEQRLLHCDD